MNKLQSDYEKQCEDFHNKRLKTADKAWNKLLEGNTKLTEYELKITTEALQYYLIHTATV